jgi:hypothetical protein
MALCIRLADGRVQVLKCKQCGSDDVSVATKGVRPMVGKTSYEIEVLCNVCNTPSRYTFWKSFEIVTCPPPKP